MSKIILSDNPENIVLDLISSILQQSSSSEQASIEQLRQLKDVMSKCLPVLTNKITSMEKLSSSADMKHEDTIIKISDVSFHEPRGKFHVFMTPTALFLEGKQFNVNIDWTNIQSMMLVASNSTAKKEGEDLLALKLIRPVRCLNRDIQHYLMTLSKHDSKNLEVDWNNYKLSGNESFVVSSLAEKLWGQPLAVPQPYYFQSISGQKSYVKCYRGIQEGALYPLPNGLLFIKPMLFIPANEIASLTAGRGGSTASTKYIDLVVSYCYWC